ncbi:copper homeostasis protein CutC [Leifsonia sp. NPDC058194]|uniref:copper homeostasis protein CutC n=1 Tax=Leifsonia sp. NPDC058194 TaxID=3346374 RepID=UPI0036DF1934
MGRPAVEIAVQDLPGIRIALAEGADRIELCSALGLGGLTPSAGLLRGAVAAAEAASRPDFVHVLVRPRGGGFVYDEDELATTVADIRFARESGASGVVVGALDEQNRVDLAAVERFVAAADGAAVTFHRALDIVPDPLEALQHLADRGVTRVLTSGGAARSIDGRDGLAALADRAAGRIQVMAGGGVRVEDIPALVAAGVDAVHLSARDTVHGAPSGPGGGEAVYDITDPTTVHAAVAAARAARD